MDCRQSESWIQLLDDGQLASEEARLLEGHLDACPSCARLQRQHRRMRTELRAAGSEVTPRPELASLVRARVFGSESDGARVRLGPVFAVAAVAGLVLFGAGDTLDAAPDPTDAAVQRHTRRLPPEVRADAQGRRVHRFLREHLGMKVQLPVIKRQGSSLRFVGARLDNLAGLDAAYVMYDDRGARVSLFAYPRRARHRRPRGFRRAVGAGGRPLFVGRRRGYNVVAWEEADVAYAVVSDVDRAELVRLVAEQR